MNAGRKLAVLGVLVTAMSLLAGPATAQEAAQPTQSTQSTDPIRPPAPTSFGVAIAYAQCKPEGPTASDTAIANQLRPQMNGDRLGQFINAYNVSCARAIIDTTRARGLASRAAVIAVTTAITESTLHNYTEAVDHDSLGLFQQRPSQGWGTPAQLTDPVYATNAFLNAMLRKFPNNSWMSGDIGAICQAVQVSAFPDAYRYEVHDAQLLVNTLWSTETGKAHAVAVSGGKVFHTVRLADSSWTNWVSLNNNGNATSVTAAADAAGNTQVTAVIDGTIHHRIRYTDGSWTNWGTLGPATQVTASIDRTANVMHLAAIINGTIHHRIRYTDGTWSNWGTLGPATQVSISVDHSHNILHMSAVIGAKLYHRVRNTNGTWTNFYPIEENTTVTTATTAADATGNTQVAELINGTANHRIRYSDGTWSTWAPIATGATAITHAVDTTHNNLQAMTIVNGTAYHRIRNTDGTWTNWQPKTPTNTTTHIAITLV